MKSTRTGRTSLRSALSGSKTLLQEEHSCFLQRAGLVTRMNGAAFAHLQTKITRRVHSQVAQESLSELFLPLKREVPTKARIIVQHAKL